MTPVLQQRFLEENLKALSCTNEDVEDGNCTLAEKEIWVLTSNSHAEAMSKNTSEIMNYLAGIE